MLSSIFIAIIGLLYGEGLQSPLAPFNEYLLPEFIDLPPPHLTLDPRSAASYPIRFSCKAWPPYPFGTVTYYSASGSRTSPVPLHPIPSEWLDHNTPQSIVLSGPDVIGRLAYSELFCLATTAFGSVLSPPFTVALTDVPRQTTVESVPVNRTAAVRCGPVRTLVHSQQVVQFTVNGTVLALRPGKHLIIQSAHVPHHVEPVLLVRDVQPSDAGLYQCRLSSDRQSSSQVMRTTELRVQDGTQSYTEWDDFALASTRSSRSHTPRLMVVEGANVSLRCAAPVGVVPNITHQSEPASVSSSSRFDPLFGVLFIDSVHVEDSGTYRCSVANRLSSLFLHVKPKPGVHAHPSLVSPTSLADQPPVISCTGTEPVSPFWYHNGRGIHSQRVNTSGSNSLYLLDALTESTVGVYQCVQRSLSGGWTSDLVLVSNRTDGGILRKSDFEQLPPPSFSPIRVQSNTLFIPLGATVTLSCGSLSSIPQDALNRLMRILPGHSDHVSDRLNLALMLGHARVMWLKDGVPLQLPTGEQSYQQFNLTVSRSHDYGLYEYVFHGSKPVLVCGMDIQPPRTLVPKSGRVVRLMEPAHGNSLDDGTDRGKRDASVPFSPDQRRSALEEEDPDSWFNPFGVPSASQMAAPAEVNTYPVVNRHQPFKPLANPIGDNLAANVTWPAVEADFYRLQLRHKLPGERRWSKPIVAEGVTPECCAHTLACCQRTRHRYFTSRQPDFLEPGRLYQFRVLAMLSNEAPLSKSLWSQSVSFEHISPVTPTITETERLPDGGVLAHWTLPSSALGFSLDHFLLLYRMERESQSGEKVAYNPFQHVFVPGGETRECKLTNLEPGRGYQLVVYGVHTPPGLDPRATAFQGGIGGRKITLFSHEVFVKLNSTSETLPSHSYLDSITHSRKSQQGNDMILNSSDSNRLMFLILGALAGLMLLVMISLIILCICHQMRKTTHTNYSRAIKRQTNSWLMEKEQQSDSGKFEARPSAFLLEQLGKVAAGPGSTTGSQNVTSNPRSTGRTSLIYSQPPPIGAPPPPPQPPPPPAHGMDMRYLVSDHGGMPQFSAHPGAPSALVHSQYPEGHGPVYPPHHVMPQSGSMPFGMKREPPSGGSVHGGTDNENEAVDNGTAVTRTVRSLAAPGGGGQSRGPSRASRNSVAVPNPLGRWDTATDQMAAYQQWSNTYVPAPGSLGPQHSYPCPSADLRIYPGMDGVANPAWLGYHSPPGLMNHANPNENRPQPGNQDASRGWPPCGYEWWHPGEYPQHAPLMMPSDSRINTVQSAMAQYPAEGEYRSVGSHCMDDGLSQPVVKRSRRRTMTAELPHGGHRQPTDLSAACPLMTSSPVAEAGPAEQYVQGELPANYQMAHWLQGAGVQYPAQAHTAVAQPYPPGHFNLGWTQYPHSLTKPAQTGSAHFGGPDWSPVLRNHTAPTQPHRNSHHGPLVYGQHNPITALDGVGTLSLGTGGPPRVRDYSEYGIPNIHGRPTHAKLPSESSSARRQHQQHRGTSGPDQQGEVSRDQC